MAKTEGVNLEFLAFKSMLFLLDVMAFQKKMRIVTQDVIP